MRSYQSATAAYLAARGGVVARVLIWIRAKNRDTGAGETIGLWNGDDHQSITIDGEDRTYFGAGSMIGSDPITMQSGVVVRMHKLVLSPLADEVALVIRGYDPRLAPVEIHRALFDTASRDLIAPPHRVFKGWIDSVSISTGGIGGESRCEVDLASSARVLTRTLALKKSDGSMQQRGGDRFARYADIAGEVDVHWGDR